MEQYVEAMREVVGGSAKGTLVRWRHARHIAPPELVEALEADGEVRPLGVRWTDGFGLRLKAGMAPVRLRFTEAHEICHTFFYELVPEIKFAPHHSDETEERLCDQGAAALLLPASEVKLAAAGRDVSIGTLEDLASRWGVALSTMYFRLRQLRLWNCRLSIWHRTVSGDFVARETYGWIDGECQWADETVLEEAWGMSRSGGLTGSTYVLSHNGKGATFALPIYFEVERRGDSILALASRKDLWQRGANLELFARRFASRPRTRTTRNARSVPH
jgi:hypothetical protein